jgi:Uma2 family endonuclease
MNNMGTKTPTTVEQFAQVHTADTEDYELVEGELIPLSNGTPKHAKIRRRVEGLVENYFETNPIGELLGEVDCRISDDTVRRPDVSIFMGGRIQAIDMEAIPVPFALAVEVLSPSESAVNVRRKVREYICGRVAAAKCGSSTIPAGKCWSMQPPESASFKETTI